MRFLDPIILFGAAALLAAVAGCDSLGTRSSSSAPQNLSTECLIPESEIRQGCQGKDCIRSLDQPELAPPGHVTYLRDSSRVVGFEIEGKSIAVALNVLRWHEVANMSVAGMQIAVTYCPLTGSAIVFDRSPVEGREFGVSGLLYKNNLIMYDRTEERSDESLWTQMRMKGDCGPKTGTNLPVVESKEMQWAQWKALHPETQVVSDEEGSTGQYRQNEYRAYERTHNDRIPFPLPNGMDERRPPKERVLGIPVGEEDGVAYPFGELEEASTEGRAVVADAVNGRNVVVFWDADGRSAEPYFAERNDQGVEFTVQEGQIVDRATGSTWNQMGRATSGPLAGTRLEPVRRGYVAFWFAWAAFQPNTSLWRADAS